MAVSSKRVLFVLCLIPVVLGRPDTETSTTSESEAIKAYREVVSMLVNCEQVPTVNNVTVDMLEGVWSILETYYLSANEAPPPGETERLCVRVDSMANREVQELKLVSKFFAIDTAATSTNEVTLRASRDPQKRGRWNLKDNQFQGGASHLLVLADPERYFVLAECTPLPQPIELPEGGVTREVVIYASLLSRQNVKLKRRLKLEDVETIKSNVAAAFNVTGAFPNVAKFDHTSC